jgi:hypothetical protein
VKRTAYRSRSHPGQRPWALVFAQESVGPIAVLMLPLMVTTLVAALRAGNLIPFLVWGYPTVIMLALAWTAFDLERRIAEVIIGEGFAVVRSIADCAHRRSFRPLPLFDVRDYGQWLVLAVGDSDIVLHRDEWPDYDSLRGELRARFYPDDR